MVLFVISSDRRSKPGSGCMSPMTVKLSRDSFVGLLTKSGLIKADALAALVAEFQAEDGDGVEAGEPFAQFLVRQGELTTWQARKLLQGKHKGFLLGKYRLLSLLGRGGMSSVYLAEHLVMRRRCAIKVLPTKRVNDTAALDRFHLEAQAAAALDDPHIVRAYDVDHVREGNAEIHFLVMEYVQGRSLQEVVDQDGPLALTDAVDYICQAASGLDHAHQAGMVHRDIKPSNLLLDPSGTVKVLDLGLARFFAQTDQQSVTLQHDQRVLGTADYLSPEQAVDSHTVDTRADIYSLGGTLYYLLAGHPPFPEGSLAQRLLAHQTKQPKSITTVRPDVPVSFARILERMMAKSPDDRPPSAKAARRDLRGWLEQHGEAFAQTTAPPVAKRPRPPADPTTAGWSDLPIRESFAPPPTITEEAAAGTDSHVVSDPNLGEFLSALSTQVDPAQTDSERLVGAKTVVSTTRPEPVKVTPPGDPSGASEIRVTDESGIGRQVSGSASLNGSRARRRTRTTIPKPVLAGGLGALALLMAGYFLWPSSGQPGGAGHPADPEMEGVGANPAEGGLRRTGTGSQRPPVEPGADVTVGPEGNFATINEAVAYVRDHFQPLSRSAQRTIRVAGGETYPESIVIDNSSFGAFPRGVRIICSDAEPAVLAPAGNDPIVMLLNVERFRLEGFRLAGQGRPVAMRLEGYLVSSAFERLTIEDVGSAAVEAVGVAGLDRKRVEFQDLLIRRVAPDAVGLSFAPGNRSTKDVLVQNCRFAGPMQSGVAFAGELEQVELKECRFDQVTTPVRFLGTGPLDSVTLVNNTFREFEQGVLFSAVPEIARRGVGLHKNLFAGVHGPEVVVAGAAGPVSPEQILGQSGARFNWSEGTGEPAGGSIDVFQNDGRRGIEPLSFAGTDAERAADFLKPQRPELRQAARSAPNPKFIGAIAPTGSGD